MKRILFILALLVVCSCLWAQTVYDTVVTRNRFSYSWAFRYAHESFDVSMDFPGYGMNPYRHDKKEAGWNGFGAVYRAEWKYFMLDLAPSIDLWRTYEGKDTTMVDFSISVQPLLKLPLIDKKFLLSLLGGPELKLRGDFGVYLNGGLDIGFKLTEHHVLFLGGLIGFDLTGVPTSDGTERRYEDAWLGATKFKEKGATRLQLTLGIKTLKLEDVFYLKGKEVNRRRR
jgi:hypothetical protein